MKRSWLAWLLLGGIFLIFVGVTLHAPLSVALGTLFPVYENLIKAWKEVLLAVLSVAAAIQLTLRRLWPVFLKSWVVCVSVAFIALHFLLIPFLYKGAFPAVAGLMIDLRFIVFFLLTYSVTLMWPNARRLLLRATAFGAVIVLGFGFLQITVLPDNALAVLGYDDDSIRPYTTIDRNPDFVRINSTLRGPNPLGALCVMYVALAGAYLLKRYNKIKQAHRALIFLSIGVAVSVLFASYSRSAYVGAVIMAALLGLSAWRMSLKQLALFGAVLGACVVGIFALQNTDWYSNVILHEDAESMVKKKSNDEHLRSLGVGLQRLSVQPLGAGIGSTGSASLYGGDPGPTIENYYLFVAHESGWLGLGLFIAFVVLALAGLWRLRSDWVSLGLFASGIGLMLIALVLPVWADETVALLWWGLAGSILGGGYAAGTCQQKTARTA